MVSLIFTSRARTVTSLIIICTGFAGDADWCVCCKRAMFGQLEVLIIKHSFTAHGALYPILRKSLPMVLDTSCMIAMIVFGSRFDS